MNKLKHNIAPTTRRDQIAEILSLDGETSVEELVERFGVSDMTIRRDLNALAQAGRIIRTHGGAAPTGRVSFEFEFLQRKRAHDPAKHAIAAAAAELIDDGSTIMLDSGTTTLRLAESLRRKTGLTIITTSLPIASSLQYSDSIEVLLLGGYLRSNSPDLTGPLTETNLEGLRADIAFIGADGVELNGDVFNASLAVGRMLQKMVAAARQVYVVADSSKIGKSAMTRFGNVAEWAGLITDNGINRRSADALKWLGVKLTKVPIPKEK
ncbi:MAG: DeoR/GlpR family DNA-binding transcription regulator [Phycisphaerae bacterium]|nr:DeoR/GlpR family DNA-binding transcription regulator [Phycisphaerae bacterium]